jgi:transposase InsO family protein
MCKSIELSRLITDAYSEKVVGYDVSNSLDQSGTVRALEKAIKSRVYKSRQLIHHSDREIQYCSNEYQSILLKNKVRCSMTESYDPYANAVAERTNGILKTEFIGQYKKLKLEVMKELVANSIKIYTELRPHYSCYMKTPNQMHRQQEVIIRTYKNKNISRGIPADVN